MSNTISTTRQSPDARQTILCYDASGRITEIISDPIRPETIAMLDGDGTRYLSLYLTGNVSLAFLDASYVLNGQLTPRPTLPASLDKSQIKADAKDTATIAGLPKPCEVTIDGRPQQITDGVLQISSASVRTITLGVSSWPYKDWAATVTVVAP